MQRTSRTERKVTRLSRERCLSILRWDCSGKTEKGKYYPVNCAVLLCQSITFSASTDFFFLSCKACVSIRRVCVALYISEVIQQKPQVLPDLILCHFAECAFLTSAHIVNSHPVHSNHLSHACLGSLTQFVHKLWLPFGPLIKVT